MSKKLKKAAAPLGKKRVTTESTGATSRLLDAPAEEVTYGPFSGSAVRELSFDVKVSKTISVPAAFYEYVKLQADQRIKCLARYDYTDVGKLVGENFWKGLNESEKVMAEGCICFLCQSGSLPLWTSGFGLKYPETYGLSVEEAKQVKASA